MVLNIYIKILYKYFNLCVNNASGEVRTHEANCTRS